MTLKEYKGSTFDAVGRGKVREMYLRHGRAGFVEFEETDDGVWINYVHVHAWARRAGVATAMLAFLYAKGKPVHTGYFLTSGECLRHVCERLKIFIALPDPVVQHSIN